MNFGITPTPTTFTTNANKPLTTTAPAAPFISAPASDSVSKDPFVITNRAQNFNIFNCNYTNTILVNPSNTFKTPQNCVKVLTSLQNNTEPGECRSVNGSHSTDHSKAATLVLPICSSTLSSNINAKIEPLETLFGIQSIKYESSSLHMDGNEESSSLHMDENEENIDELNICFYFERKLLLSDEVKTKHNNSSILENCSDIANALPLDSTNSHLITATDLNASGGSDKEQTEATDCNIVDNGVLTDLHLNETNASTNPENILRSDKDSLSKSSENSGDSIKSVYSFDCIDKIRNVSRLSDRAKKKSWYNVLYPNYKSRSQDFKKLFKDVPNDERLIVDYSCALYRDLLIQGRLYISQNYVCFHANILGWETCVIIKWKDVISITKEKTALVIPNAISICTPQGKFFFSSFTARDKTFLILFRVWQNTLLNKPMPAQEIWRLVHNYYGDELGLTTDDEDYIDPTAGVQDDSALNLEYVSAIKDPCSLSLYEETTEGSSKNTFHPLESSSGYIASDNNSENNSSTSDTCKNSNTMKTISKESAPMSPNCEAQQTLASKAASDNVENSSNNAVTRESKQNASPFDSKRKVSKNNRQREETTIKKSETLPTDVSDSSDSEENNIPFVATAECNSTHEGRQLVHTILPINIETLFNMLFSKSKFLLDFHAMRKSTDLVFGEWATKEDGQKTRTFNVTVQLAASVGPKTSRVTEFQLMRDCSKPGELYSIDINNVNAGIPYADSFSVLVHYCLVKTVDDHTMLSVHAQIKYKKSIWGVVKGFIEKNTWAGLDDFYSSLLHSLQSETCIPPAKGKGRRPRRGTAAQIRPPEEMPILQTKPEPAELGGITQTVSARHPIDNPVMAAESTTKFRWLSLFVLALLCFLIIVNVILLLKLWKLEDRIENDLSTRTHIPNLAVLKQLPNNHEDWIELLRHQEVLHESELKKWHTVLQTAIELLKKTEKALAELTFR